MRQREYNSRWINRAWAAAFSTARAVYFVVAWVASLVAAVLLSSSGTLLGSSISILLVVVVPLLVALFLLGYLIYTPYWMHRDLERKVLELENELDRIKAARPQFLFRIDTAEQEVGVPTRGRTPVVYFRIVVENSSEVAAGIHCAIDVKSIDPPPPNFVHGPMTIAHHPGATQLDISPGGDAQFDIGFLVKRERRYSGITFDDDMYFTPTYGFLHWAPSTIPPSTVLTVRFTEKSTPALVGTYTLNWDGNSMTIDESDGLHGPYPRSHT